MALINKRPAPSMPASEEATPKSLAIALATAKQHSKKSPTVTTKFNETKDERPSSIAEAILAKKKASLAALEAPEESEELIEEDETDISDLLEPEAEEPKDMLSAIRAKIKARMQSE